MDQKVDKPQDEASCIGHAHPTRDPYEMPSAVLVERAAQMLRAAGDPARLRLLLHLSRGERCVTELAEEVGEKMGTISARLKQLDTAQLVSKRREAKHIYYTLADDHVVGLVRDILEHAAEGGS